MKLIEQLKEFRSLILAVITIVTLTLGSVSYFATAEALNSHIRNQELKELVNVTIQYELNYKCYRESCRNKMAPELYIQYMKFLQEIERLKGK